MAQTAAGRFQFNNGILKGPVNDARSGCLSCIEDQEGTHRLRGRHLAIVPPRLRIPDAKGRVGSPPDRGRGEAMQSRATSR